MIRVVIYLKDQEHSTLVELAEREYRTIQSQAAMIIRNTLENLGLLPVMSHPKSHTTSQTIIPGKEETHDNG